MLEKRPGGGRTEGAEDRGRGGEGRTGRTCHAFVSAGLRKGENRDLDRKYAGRDV